MRTVAALAALLAVAAAEEPEAGIRALFESIAEAERAGDPDAAAARLDWGEVFRQIGEDPDGAARARFEGRLPTELGSPLSDMPPFDGAAVRKIVVDGARAQVVCDHGSRGRFRWHIVRGDASWRIFDFEELEAPIRFTAAVAVVLDADAELYGSLLGLLGARTALLRGEAEDAKRRLEDPGALPPSLDAARRLLLAEARLALGDFRGAIESCEALGPDVPAAHLVRAAASLELGDSAEALAAARKYVDAAGGHPDAWAIAGAALRETGRGEEAAAAHREGLKEDPASEDNLLGLLLALPPDGKDGIAAHFGEIADKEAAFAWMAAECLAAADLAALEKLIALFRKAVPGHPEADFYEGHVLLTREEFGRAAEAFFRALGQERDPERNARYVMDFVYAAWLDGRGVDGFRSLPEEDRTLGFYVLAAEMAEAKDAANLEQLLEARRQQGGAGAELFLWEAEAHWLGQRYAEVVSVLGKHGAAILDLESVDGWRVPDRWIRSLVRLGRAAEALERARAEGDAFYELLAHAALGDEKAAAAAFERCLEAGFAPAELHADEDLGPLLK